MKQSVSWHTKLFICYYIYIKESTTDCQTYPQTRMYSRRQHHPIKMLFCVSYLQLSKCQFLLKLPSTLFFIDFKICSLLLKMNYSYIFHIYIFEATKLTSLNLRLTLVMMTNSNSAIICLKSLPSFSPAPIILTIYKRNPLKYLSR